MTSQGTTPPTPGAIVGFPVHHGYVSDEPITTQIADITMDFGSVFISESELFLSDPSYGVSILELGADLKFTERVHTVVASQKAICWAEYDPNLGTAYGNDAGQNKVFKFNAQTGVKEGVIHVSGDGNPDDAGLFDAAIDLERGIVYSLITGNGVIAIDLNAGKQVQFLDLSSFGSRVGYQGMALY